MSIELDPGFAATNLLYVCVSVTDAASAQPGAAFIG